MAAITKPYHLTVRQFSDGQYTEGGRSRYIEHPKYSSNPSRFVRGFELLQKDLLTLFEYIEPSKFSKDTYSFRTFEFLLRTSTEIEANCKSIFKLNTYTQKVEERWNMTDYFKINKSHYLSDYRIKMPFWDGSEKIRQPFKEWSGGSFQQLTWYDAYNQVKHDRTGNLHYASFNNLINAFCGLVVILTTQFLDNDFMQRASAITDEGPNDGFESTIGGYFRVELPKSIPYREMYDFNWQTIKDQADPFEKFNYDSV
ncbi:MAG TPA: hypothetical protein VLE51_01150 [Candidatus Saccharimonadales bacterium]|nr:hypothetical protein [Candidatus Saccharimonadales bacterium]